MKDLTMFNGTQQGFLGRNFAGVRHGAFSAFSMRFDDRWQRSGFNLVLT